MEESEEGIVEGREECMVSPTGGEPTIRKAHFIKPSTDSITEPFSKLHFLSLSSFPAAFNPKNCALEVNFNGWRYPQKDWTAWVEKMASLHESTWKKAGIHEAIITSTYTIPRSDDLVFGVAERWFDETKSFIFPWGEATITLEDIMILGGFSVLGFPVFYALETDELKETMEKLENARTEFSRTPAKKARHLPWMKKFMDTNSEIEHEAFLALWLSRFVFPSGLKLITKSILPIAIHLARGTRIALAPAVLASIYRDLSMLKAVFVSRRELVDHEKIRGHRLATINIWSPFQLVQVWTSERFLELRPKPNLIRNGEPRLARWHDLKSKVKNVRSVLDLATGGFEWRPYVKTLTNWKFPKFYDERGMWVSVDSGLNDELSVFAQCLRVSELVGLDHVEQYLPHRVALQFGLDQDLPGFVARSDGSPEIAWDNYSRPVGGGTLYIPSRFYEADVTTRYLEWWKESASSLQEPGDFSGSFNISPLLGMVVNATSTFGIACALNLKRKTEVDIVGAPSKILKSSAHSSKIKEDNCVSIPLLSPPKSFQGAIGCSEETRKPIIAASPLDLDSYSSENSIVVLEAKKSENSNSVLAKPPFRTSKEVLHFGVQKKLDTSCTPPAFPPKGKIAEANGSFDEDDMTTGEVIRSFSKQDCDCEKPRDPESHSLYSVTEAQLTLSGMAMLKSRNKLEIVEYRELRNNGNSSHPCQGLLSSTTESRCSRCKQLLTASSEKFKPNDSATGGSKISIPTVFESRAENPIMDNSGSPDSEKEDGNSYIVQMSGLDLDTWIIKLEGMVARLKAIRSGSKV
ncbi:hypothetical protein SLA2020_383380 [Shorea laevis]